MKAQNTRVKHSSTIIANRILDVSASLIGDGGAKHLAEGLKHANCKLNVLRFLENGIIGEGVMHLAEALKHSNCKVSSPFHFPLVKSLDLYLRSYLAEP